MQSTLFTENSSAARLNESLPELIASIALIMESLSFFFFGRFVKAFCKFFYYIPTNVISLDTIDITECDTMLRITTLWLSESISPLSETDDVVHNVFLNTQCMIRACQLDVIRHFGSNYCYNDIIIYIYFMIICLIIISY